MKKHVKKLSLNRETLRHLQGSDMQWIAGGVDTSAQCLMPTGCECGTQDGCAPLTGAMRTCSAGGTSIATCTL
ncbi:MAG TPA: class I lanthipeptide [Thermoanaerobaculia bacterium]|jgi:hypothetical protein|nr:class I lanthipeptide [Thermoanaerobaculia bacterium]